VQNPALVQKSLAFQFQNKRYVESLVVVIHYCDWPTGLVDIIHIRWMIVPASELINVIGIMLIVGDINETVNSIFENLPEQESETIRLYEYL